MEEELDEKNSSSSSQGVVTKFTLQKAVELGEYKPDFLAQFPEWHTFTRHVQFEFIRKAIENRNRQLIMQWAEITNVLDFRLKPHLSDALKNIEKQLEVLKQDKEDLYVDYSQ